MKSNFASIRLYSSVPSTSSKNIRQKANLWFQHALVGSVVLLLTPFRIWKPTQRESLFFPTFCMHFLMFICIYIIILLSFFLSVLHVPNTHFKSNLQTPTLIPLRGGGAETKRWVLLFDLVFLSSSRKNVRNDCSQLQHFGRNIQKEQQNKGLEERRDGTPTQC